MSESDGIDEAIGQNIREALASAERAGRIAAPKIERVRAMWQQMREDDRRRAELQARYREAWEKAHDKLKVVDDEQWWEHATPAEIAEVYEIAVTWREHEKEADRADDVIYAEVLQRYGHDLRTPSAEQVREDLEKIQAHQTEQDTEEKEEQSEDQAVEQTQQRTQQPTHGPTEQRERMAEEMRESGVDPELIEELTDTHQRVAAMNATPPYDAVERKHAATRLSGPRGTRTRARQTENTVSR